MENKLPTVAVIVCNYNYGRWLNGSLKSAATQDYPNKLIVVIDDASTDDSFSQANSICSEAMIVQEEDEEKLVYHNSLYSVPLFYIKLKKNGGPSRARNIGINYVKDQAHMFAILDADDVFIQGKISKCVAKIMEAPDVIGGVYADYLHLSPEGVFSYESKEPYSRERLVQDCIIHSGSVINKLALDRVGLYDEELRVAEDYNLFMRISNYFLFYHIPEALTIVRIGKHQSSTTVSQERWREDYIKAKQRGLGIS
jgi:glycosyltransferase involved in cell wall biosynthesis